MRVLLGLGDAQLGHAHLAQILAKAVFHADAREGDEHVRHGRVILGVADVGEREELALEAVERGVDERARDLAGAVGAVVEEDDRIVVGDHAVLVADDGLDEFVRHAVFIALLNGMNGVGILHALAVDERVIGVLEAVPALVAVHRVVAAHNGRDLADAELTALFHGLCDKVAAGGRGRVAPVEERVDIHAL